MKLPIVKNYIDDTYRMPHEKRDELCENPLQFDITRWLFNPTDEHKARVLRNISRHIRDGKLIQTPWAPDDPMSHDILTAVFVFSWVINRVGLIENLYEHYGFNLDKIRDRTFLRMLSLKPTILIGRAWLSATMVYSCLRTGQTRPYPWKRIKPLWLYLTGQISIDPPVQEGSAIRRYYRYKDGRTKDLGIWSDKRPYTSGPLLCWLRFQTGLFPKTKRLCEAILKRRYGDKYWYEIFKIYFKYDDHPIVIAAKEKYDAA